MRPVREKTGAVEVLEVAEGAGMEAGAEAVTEAEEVVAEEDTAAEAVAVEGVEAMAGAAVVVINQRR
ncbi:MAG: hypothetical protein NVSMB9_21070 [Isosphaeraceae bacterium]